MASTHLSFSDQALVSKPALTLEAAQHIAAAAHAHAMDAGAAVSICILDDGGHLLHFLRMTGCHAGPAEVAIAKARTAAMFKRPTQVFADSVANGAHALLAMPGLLPFPGGVPLISGEVLTGAIGVSGANPQLDAEIAAAGAASFDSLCGRAAASD